LSQDLLSSDHSLDGEGTQQVEIDGIEQFGVFAAVAARPFHGVADGSHASEVNSRGQPAFVLVFDQIGERHIGGIVVFIVPSHDQGEGADACRPEQIGVAGGLGAPFDDSMVNGPQFVHVVTLVGTAARVTEREQSGNKQGGLVVRDGKGAGEDAAGLPVKALTVAEEKGVDGRIVFAQNTSLPNKAVGHHGMVADLGARRDDKSFGHHVVSHQAAVVYVTVDRSLLEA